ncbi:unnamed protein product [Adineta steineri]|uniref:GAIN-B domain-containing protein n=1 Tax=Adineta steineri TaxID=433720 RepID=A0A814JRB1_9BILA|nr:unnamed protein product [Adineta steineri]CAF1041510.1 unnamed protein product [Adineta steineri]
MVVNIRNVLLINLVELYAQCIINPSGVTMTFTCPNGVLMEDIDVYSLDDAYLETIEKVQVVGIGGRGPLTSIPINICRFKQLKHLDLSNNHINDVSFHFFFRCLSQLQTLDLHNNFIDEIPISWISEMISLKSINLSQNKISSIPNNMFYNISNIEIFDVSSNSLTTFELWLIQIKDLIDYSNNRITHFTNEKNVDLSNYQSEITTKIFFNNTGTKIDFDDGIFEMYNRCGEINSMYTQYLMKTIQKIHEMNPNLLNWNCSCKYYHLQKYMISIDSNKNLSSWNCPFEHVIDYDKKCQCQSSFNSESVKLCQIKDWELDTDFPLNCSTLESISSIMYKELISMNLTNETMIVKFVDRIDRFDKKLYELNISQLITPLLRTDLQNITTIIENLLESIKIPVEITNNSIAILSLPKKSSTYSYSQTKLINSSFTYSKNQTIENVTTSITIHQNSIENLSEIDIYIIYYLPSSLFSYAQNDQHKIIVSPIVGIHLPKPFPYSITMTFTHVKDLYGRYSCEFWQTDHWNNTGCSYSKGVKPNQHTCICNHTTSFALIFIPDWPIYEAYIPSIIIASLSIVCFCISIILSIHRQVTSFRILSIVNIFSLINSMILFILLTVILIRGYQLSDRTLQANDKCSKSQENLSMTMYFFLILTFASKTLLGVCYFITIFFHFIFIQYTSISNKLIYTSFILIILIALIPTIVIVNQSSNLFLQYDGICWFDSKVIFPYISIPFLIFIGLNFLIIIAITVRLFQFICGPKTAQTNEKRMIISVMIWLSLCISLGIAWIVGPFLNIIITENNRSSTIVLQWIFAFFIGLEGVWVLIINAIFYSNQKVNRKNHQTIFNKINKSDS